MIELRDITIANNKNSPLIENQTLTVPSGSLTALIGRNGCGKSTLLRTLSGEQKPLSGSILIDGVDVSKESARKLAQRISYISTESVKVRNLTCREFVSYGRSPYTGMLGKLSANDVRIVGEALAAVGMTSFSDRQVSKISDGEGRRILLAKALAQQTAVILLDEPTSFLDVPWRYEIVSMLSDLAKTKSKTILYSTHEFTPAFKMADGIVLMLRDGLLLLSPSEMRRCDEFVQTFGQVENNL
ncbi:MAG: ABC transporter ATP-binding protein [Bacteroides sp.]|nr:ABC transporter ATP-binding protein [Bacteroides sp.]MCM1379978.1 ABC transporter ATP-binding protein [Bacteroides sp.]MCM1446267.1 ABC transporter ATP-binding protein [Prevotella sp.]